VLVLHGEAGGFDELVIALVAFGVLWLAVRLAGRKSADETEEGSTEHRAAEENDSPDGTHPPTTTSRG